MEKTSYKNGLIAIAILFVIAIVCSFVFKPTSGIKEKMQTFQKEDSVTAICKELCEQNGYTEYRIVQKEKEEVVVEFFPNEYNSIDHWIIYPERNRFCLLEREW